MESNDIYNFKRKYYLALGIFLVFNFNFLPCLRFLFVLYFWSNFKHDCYLVKGIFYNFFSSSTRIKSELKVIS